MNAPRFDVDAVMRKWGFTYHEVTLIQTARYYQGQLDGRLHTVMEERAPRFATELLMRN